MERVTGKTTDAYVEFHTLEDASKAVEKHHQNISRGRVTRIGQRPVEIELSSESALMKDLFPSAKGVFWNGGNPQILPNNDEEPWDNFKGFVSNEEMTMLVKHVEVPHRVSSRERLMDRRDANSNTVSFFQRMPPAAFRVPH